MRESWTDARMDDLNFKVDELGRRVENGFNRVDADLRELRRETKAEFTAVRGEMRVELGGMRTEMRVELGGMRNEMRVELGGMRNEMRAELGGMRTEMNERLEGLENRLAAMHRLMIQFSGVALAALIGFIATQV